MKAIQLVVVVTVTSFAQNSPQQPVTKPEQIRAAASRAIAILQRSATDFYKSQNCFSCHSHALPMMVFRMAREEGVPVDEAAAREVAVKGFLGLPDRSSVDAAVQGSFMLDPATDDGWELIDLHAAGVEPNLVTAAYAQRLASLQQADGHWLSGAF